MAVKVVLDIVKLKHLQVHAPQVLDALDVPMRAAVADILSLSRFMVPRGDPDDDSNLLESGFVSGPHRNMSAALSSSWSCGYEHPQAGAIHEGFHWGSQTVDPAPEWLKLAFKARRGRARKGVTQALKDYLTKQFPPK
ncbi:hypothetical protein JGU66_18745 [Myxococcaceae bacterium JPH2]|nr:hypothetical protein [Myxococcaceae bacterium JPH2]